MNPDPVVAEVRAIRQAFASRYNNDIGEIFGALRKLGAEHPEHHVTLPPKRPTDLETEAEIVSESRE